jgi:hypothetical protein
MSFWTPLWLEMKHGVFTTLLNPSNSHCNGAIRIPPDIRIRQDFESALPFQTRLTQTKPVLPLSKEHGSKVKDQGRRQCCHNKHKKFPYRPTHDVSLLPWHIDMITHKLSQASYIVRVVKPFLSREKSSTHFLFFSPEYFLSPSSHLPHRTNTPPSLSLRQQRSNPTLHTYTHPPSTCPCTVKNSTGHTWTTCKSHQEYSYNPSKP